MNIVRCLCRFVRQLKINIVDGCCVLRINKCIRSQFDVCIVCNFTFHSYTECRLCLYGGGGEEVVHGRNARKIVQKPKTKKKTEWTDDTHIRCHVWLIAENINWDASRGTLELGRTRGLGYCLSHVRAKFYVRLSFMSCAQTKSESEKWNEQTQNGESEMYTIHAIPPNRMRANEVILFIIVSNLSLARVVCSGLYGCCATRSVKIVLWWCCFCVCVCVREIWNYANVEIRMTKSPNNNANVCTSWSYGINLFCINASNAIYDDAQFLIYNCSRIFFTRFFFVCAICKHDAAITMRLRLVFISFIVP